MDFGDVVQKLDQLVSVLAHVLHGSGLLDGVEVLAYLLDAATCGADNAIEVFEVLDEEVFRLRGVALVSAVGHRLSTTGLSQRITRLEAEPLQELEGRNADFGEQQIDVARDEQTNPHAARLRHPLSRIGFCRHVMSPLPSSSIVLPNYKCALECPRECVGFAISVMIVSHALVCQLSGMTVTRNHGGRAINKNSLRAWTYGSYICRNSRS